MRASNPPRIPLPPGLWRLRAFQRTVIDLNDWLIPFVTVNFVWFVLSLSVVLLPPATVALADTAYRAYKGQTPDVREFLGALRRWFITGWLWAGANLILLGVAAAAVVVLQENSFAIGFVGALAALALMVQFYTLPYLMLQERPNLILAWRNSLFTVLGDPLHLALNLGIVVLILVPALILVAPILLIVPVGTALLSTHSLVVWLQHKGILASETSER